MFDTHYKLEQPKGLTVDQVKFWNEKFVKTLKGVRFIHLDVEESGVQNMELIFAHGFHEAAHEIGVWFVTKLMMDPDTKEKGPLWNNKDNQPVLVTGAGSYRFFVSAVDDTGLRLRLHTFIPAE